MDFPFGRVAKWQTRWLQVPVFERTCGFKSRLAHHNNGLFDIKRCPVETDGADQQLLWGSPRVTPTGSVRFSLKESSGYETRAAGNDKAVKCAP